MARPDGADYDPSAGEISWEGIREFVRNMGSQQRNQQVYASIWWREEEERRLNFCEHLFGLGVAAVQTKMFADNMVLYGMAPITPGNGQHVRLQSWSPIRYYQQ